MTQPTDKKFRTVIVDDEELARQVLREFLTAHPEIEIAAECANGFEAVKSVTELSPILSSSTSKCPSSTASKSSN